METSGKRTRKRLTPDEDDETKLKTLAIALLSFSRDKNQPEQNQPTTKKIKLEEDDSKETLKLLLRWNKPNIPPTKIVSVMGQRCSKPIRKQLTESDEKKDQNRLILGKNQVDKNFLPLLEESEMPRKEGIEVSVYGPDGEVHEMMFKMWGAKTPVLMSGWNKFVQKYKLEKHCDFLTIWMFKNRDSRKICFAIDSTRLSVTKPLSRRISNAAFKDSN